MPEVDANYDVFIPVNEYVWKVKKLLLKSLSDLYGGIIDLSKNYILFNANTGNIYTNNQIIIETDIKNATKIIITLYEP